MTLAETERALTTYDPGFSTDLSTDRVEKTYGVIFQIAVDTPVRRVFDYLPPADFDEVFPPLGVRVRVPFGRRQTVGILVGVAAGSSLTLDKLKHASALLDRKPIFDAVTLELIQWAAEYYHHPLGEAMAAALPVALREGQTACASGELLWTLTAAGHQRLGAPAAAAEFPTRQLELLRWVGEASRSSADLSAAKVRRARLLTLRDRGWVVLMARINAVATTAPVAVAESAAGVTLTAAQTAVIDAVTASLGQSAAYLLYGVTGSGKTEVYLRAIAAAVARGQQTQALVLVPEIGLTPQLVQRFRDRFSGGVAVLHSGLTKVERRDAWRSAHNGDAAIVIGTRSAIFTSLPHLALIVVDEEHDASYKQQEGFRYSARDLAVWRARRAGVPIVLGSATPSLESLENVAQGRYSKLVLPHRTGTARPPQMNLVDLRRHACEQGLSQPAIGAIQQHLTAGGQIIVFLNRRGYAPTLFCNTCGWVAPCEHCDARMTVHRGAAQLRCHHCGSRTPLPNVCGHCGHPLIPVGQGTERVEETLTRLFPAAPLARLDRDTARPRGAVEAVIERIHRGEARILIGTQMLTKGHHFPEVSLVVILDADQGLFASDFRATERLAQTVTQVAGRAGRAARAGQVLIQTEFPEHPLLTRLIADGYEAFATSALAERREAEWPPYSRLAMLRAEARDPVQLDRFLHAAADAGRALTEPPIKILGPAAALIARRADHFRAHVLIEAPARAGLQRFLTRWLAQIETLSARAGLRWSIDVDPLEVD